MKLTVVAVFLALLSTCGALTCHDCDKTKECTFVECPGSCMNSTLKAKDGSLTRESTCWPDKEISKCNTVSEAEVELKTCYCNEDNCNVIEIEDKPENTPKTDPENTPKTDPDSSSCVTGIALPILIFVALSHTLL